MVMKSTLLFLSRQEKLKNFVLGFEFAQRVSRRFVSGETQEQAISAVKDLNQKGFLATLDRLGENVTNQEEAIRAADDYLLLLDKINQNGIDSNVSCKLTQMGLDLDFEFCLNNVKRIVERAKGYNNFVRIDMEDSPRTDKTLQVCFTLHREYQNVGAVIQSYLYRSEEDVRKLLEQKIRIRLCKGAYKEPKTVAFQKKKEVDENFVKLMKMMLKSGVYHGIATHDDKMVQATIDFAKKENITKESYEFQFLYGIRRELQEELVKQGYNIRIYVPYGDQWYPYFMRRMAERPANLFFVAKNFFRR
ncbi:MAG: proline dehydrogenase family protein [candidate division Zixibacteria bacterium]|nr:proline dehydrogenase family protein [candidate division Zixibacteria bacterium]